MPARRIVTGVQSEVKNFCRGALECIAIRIDESELTKHVQRVSPRAVHYAMTMTIKYEHSVSPNMLTHLQISTEVGN